MMKTKITFLTIALAALVGLGVLMAFKQNDNTNKKSVIFIRFLETTYGGTDAYHNIYIIENGKLLKTIDIAKSTSKETMISNYERISSVITEYINAGYELKSSAGANNNTPYPFTEYILIKD